MNKFIDFFELKEIYRGIKPFKLGFRECRRWSDMIVLMDEPEAGISLSNQKKILNAFRIAVRKGCQLIISTHSYILISKVKEVFCLDTKKIIKGVSQWVTGSGIQ